MPYWSGWVFFLAWKYPPSLKLTASLPLKMVGKEDDRFLLGWPIFRGKLLVLGRVEMRKHCSIADQMFRPQQFLGKKPQKTPNHNLWFSACEDVDGFWSWSIHDWLKCEPFALMNFSSNFGILGDEVERASRSSSLSHTGTGEWVWDANGSYGYPPGMKWQRFHCYTLCSEERPPI